MLVSETVGTKMEEEIYDDADEEINGGGGEEIYDDGEAEETTPAKPKPKPPISNKPQVNGFKPVLSKKPPPNAKPAADVGMSLKERMALLNPNNVSNVKHLTKTSKPEEHSLNVNPSLCSRIIYLCTYFYICSDNLQDEDLNTVKHP